MNFKEGEHLIKEYYFNRSGNTYFKGVLTNKRFILVKQTSKDCYIKENYPLSRLASVRVEKKESNFRAKVLCYSIILTIILLILTAYILFIDGFPNWYEAAFLLSSYVVLGLMFNYALKPDKVDVNLVVSEYGNDDTKLYTIEDSNGLKVFVDKIKLQYALNENHTH